MKAVDLITHSSIALGELPRGEAAIVTGLVRSAAIGPGDAGETLLARLGDLGFVPGAHCQVVARMWPAGDPLVVRIGGSTFALRRVEAAAVRVQRLAELTGTTETFAARPDTAAA